jgi:hypothetical protein
MLEDISAFIHHITNGKPTSFKTNDTLAISLKKPGEEEARRYTLTDCSEDLLRSILEQTKEEDDDLEMKWKAFRDDVYIPFEEFLDEALLPPAGHSGMLYGPAPIRYSLHGFVCDISSVCGTF